MSQNNLKFALNQYIQATGVLVNGSDISDESKVRFVIENAGGGNTVVVKGKISGEGGFSTVLATLSGSVNQVVNVSTYDQIHIECTVYSTTSNGVKVVASSFNDAGGAAIDLIGVPSGTSLDGFSEFSFTSSDSSVSITGDNVLKEIDFTVSPTLGGTYSNPFLIADWNLSAPNYNITISAGTHGKGLEPKVSVYEKSGTDYIEVTLGELRVTNTGTVSLAVNSSPDLRFDGKILIF